MRVAWTEHAYAQLDEAMAFIARDKPQVAAEWLDRILDSATDLADFPDLGRVVPEAARKDIRELIISPYRLIYRRDPDSVTVTMVLHERRVLDEDATIARDGQT
ncbi:MAG: type II toxin-antitoxin system RelE/ParE family toxin [Coriobacteriia bacterium]|nr:type II toxin-antitoxin system RelE/ParE family toxin [Coriobacteriia bacterium]